MLEPKEVGTESERVFVVTLSLEDEGDGDGGRKDVDGDKEGGEEGEGVKTGGQGGKVIDEEERVLVRVDRVDKDDDSVMLKLKSELDDELRLDDGMGKLKLKLEPDGKSKVIDNGTSGTDDEYEE